MLEISNIRIQNKRNRQIAFIIHYVFKISFSIYFLFRKRKGRYFSLEDIRKILVIRTDGLGDLVDSTPAFDGIRDAFPKSQIVLLAANWSKNLVEVMPFFNRVIYFDFPWIVKKVKKKLISLYNIIKRLRREKFDLVIDLRGDFRNNILMYLSGIKYRLGFNITGCGFLLTHVVPIVRDNKVESGLELIKYLKPNVKKEYPLKLFITNEDRNFSDFFLKENGVNYKGNDNIIVIVHPGANWYGRQWKPERYAQIVDFLISGYAVKVVLAGSAEELNLISDIVRFMKYKPVIAAGKTTLRQFLSLVEKSDLFIGVDSGPIHMAIAMGKKVVAILGPAPLEAVGLYGNNFSVVTRQKKFPCCPCPQTICKIPNNSCMNAVTVEDVWKEVEKQIKAILLKKDRKINANFIN